MRLNIIVKLQGKPETIWEDVVTVPARVWNGIRDGWDDVDEYDACWNELVEIVTDLIPSSYRWEDWYIDNWRKA